MKKFRRIISLVMLLALLCACVSGCKDETTTQTPTDETEPSATQAPTEETLPVPAEPIDLSTTGGAVVVGTVCYDENGWFLTPEQPLNVQFHYFLDKPSQFDKLTRIELFPSNIDGIEKGLYFGKTITVEGTFRFYRDDFEKLYMLPYTIHMGKTATASYAAPDLQAPDLTQNRYDPSKPLPQYMAPMIQDGKYTYNPYMLSRETLELMGNDFAVFYCDFVNAFLRYQAECPCPSKDYAQMLTTIIYLEFPLYDVCAESFEFFKHYDPATKTVTIPYKYDKTKHQQQIDTFMAAANAFLSTTAPNQTQTQLAKNIYHQICTSVTYDDSALEDFQRKNAYYAYMEHTGVCVTFANVYNQMLTQVGIETTIAQCDYTETLGHLWSVITIDGNRYFCDPTFELNYDKGAGYLYFGQTYAQRLANNLGQNGITAGRYQPFTIDASYLSATPLQ